MNAKTEKKMKTKTFCYNLIDFSTPLIVHLGISTSKTLCGIETSARVREVGTNQKVCAHCSKKSLIMF